MIEERVGYIEFMSEKYLYILMRNDLPSMQSGRAAAQASHAANAFIHKYGNLPEVKEWTIQTPQGFGTAIVLGINLVDLTLTVKEAGRNKYPSELVVDPDYAITISSEIIPFLDKTVQTKTIKLEQSASDPTKYILHREEVTCGYIFGNKDDLKPLLGDLPLYS